MKKFTLISVTTIALIIPALSLSNNHKYNNNNNNNNNNNQLNYIDNKYKINYNNINHNKMTTNNQDIVKRVLISGSSGFIGENIIKSLKNNEKYEVYRLVRREPKNQFEIEWNPDKSAIDKDALESVQPNIVIHLGGENIMGFWTEDKKKRILESRTKSTRTLAEAITQVNNPPELFITASGCTFYGSNVYEPVDEFTSKGKGFFSDVVEKWEGSCEPIIQYNQKVVNQNVDESSNYISSSTSDSKQPIRLVNLRIGLVLGKEGGLLGAMYYPFLFGLGGVIGSGKQYLPWVSIRDTVGIINYSMENPKVNGPINVTSINPATNYEFTKTLGKVLNRPTICWIPETPLRILLGKDMSEETVLSSQRVLPTKLLNYGFVFQDTNLEETLDEILNKNKS